MKFAYLLLVHGNFNLLKELIGTLDSVDNDIFIHLDLKAGTIDTTPFEDIAKYSKVIFINKRVDVKWGHISIVEATFNLLEESLKGNYDYYHLLSGVDFPIKSNSYIKYFFLRNNGKEFVNLICVYNFRSKKIIIFDFINEIREKNRIKEVTL